HQPTLGNRPGHLARLLAIPGAGLELDGRVDALSGARDHHVTLALANRTGHALVLDPGVDERPLDHPAGVTSVFRLLHTAAVELDGHRGPSLVKSEHTRACARQRKCAYARARSDLGGSVLVMPRIDPDFRCMAVAMTRSAAACRVARMARFGVRSGSLE